LNSQIVCDLFNASMMFIITAVCALARLHIPPRFLPSLLTSLAAAAKNLKCRLFVRPSRRLEI
jgi:hypothetical protein